MKTKASKLQVTSYEFGYADDKRFCNSSLVTCHLSLVNLRKVVQERGHAFEGMLALTFNFDVKLHLGLANAAQVLYALQRSIQADALAAEDGLSEAHVVHAVVDHHLEVVHLNKLVPHKGKEREGEVAVGYGLLEGTFYGSTFWVNVNPLVVDCGIGKLVDALLGNFNPVARTE